MKVTKQSNNSSLRLLVEDIMADGAHHHETCRRSLPTVILVRYACSCNVRTQGSVLHKVSIIMVRSSISGFYFVQTHGACSEGQVRWVQPENGAVTRYFASIILMAEVQSVH
jgi:hypothetical protein